MGWDTYYGSFRVQPTAKKLSEQDSTSFREFLKQLVDPGNTDLMEHRHIQKLTSHPILSDTLASDLATDAIPDVPGDRDGADSDVSDDSDADADIEDHFPMDNDLDNTDPLTEDLERNLHAVNSEAQSVFEIDESLAVAEVVVDQSNVSIADLSISEDEVLFPLEDVAWVLSESMFTKWRTI